MSGLEELQSAGQEEVKRRIERCVSCVLVWGQFTAIGITATSSACIGVSLGGELEGEPTS